MGVVRQLATANTVGRRPQLADALLDAQCSIERDVAADQAILENDMGAERIYAREIRRLERVIDRLADGADKNELIAIHAGLQTALEIDQQDNDWQREGMRVQQERTLPAMAAAQRRAAERDDDDA